MLKVRKWFFAFQECEFGGPEWPVEEVSRFRIVQDQVFPPHQIQAISPVDVKSPPASLLQERFGEEGEKLRKSINYIRY